MPTTLRVAGLLTAIEAVAILGTGVWLTVGSIGASAGGPGGHGAALSSAILLFVLGFGTMVLSYGVLRGRRWSRGPTVVIELLMVPIAFQLLQEPTTPAGVALLIGAIAVLVLMFLPSSTSLFTANS